MMLIINTLQMPWMTDDDVTISETVMKCNSWKCCCVLLYCMCKCLISTHEVFLRLVRTHFHFRNPKKEYKTWSQICCETLWNSQYHFTLMSRHQTHHEQEVFSYLCDSVQTFTGTPHSITVLKHQSIFWQQNKMKSVIDVRVSAVWM